MNIFILDRNPIKAVEYLGDVHVSKMVLETAQILCTGYAYSISRPPYKITHFNHPCCVWARETKGNYVWLLRYGLAIYSEFKFRFRKSHASSKVIDWCAEHLFSVSLASNSHNKTEFVQAMPEQYRSSNPIEAYRHYYATEKKDLLNYTRRNAPKWLRFN